MFIGKTYVEAEAPTLWPPDVKSQLIGKDPDVRKDGKQKGMFFFPECLHHPLPHPWSSSLLELHENWSVFK